MLRRNANARNLKAKLAPCRLLPLSLLLVAGAAMSSRQLLPAAMAQPPEPEFARKFEITEGVTVDLWKMRWEKVTTLAPSMAPFGEHQGKALAIWYRVESTNPQVQLPQGKGWSEYVRMNIKGPNGENASRKQIRSDIYWWQDVDPRWSKATLEFEMRHPQAPPNANGEFREELEWKEIPLPTRRNEMVLLNRELVTQHGTKIILEKMAWRTARQRGTDGVTFGQDALQLVVRVVPTGKIPDLKTTYYLDPGNATDDKNTDLTAKRFMPPMDYQMGHPERDRALREFVLSDAIPAANATTMNLKLRVHEQAASLKQPQWFLQHSIELRPRDLVPSAPGLPFKPLAVAETAVSTVSLHKIFPLSMPGQFIAEVLVREKHPLAHYRLFMPETTARDDLANEYQSFGFPHEVFWKADDTPVGDGERLYHLTFFPKDSPNLQPAHPQQGNLQPDLQQDTPKQVSLQVGLQYVRNFKIDFPDVALPAPGERVKLQKVHRDASGAEVELASVGVFDAEHPDPLFELLPGKVVPPYVAFISGYTPAPGLQNATLQASGLKVDTHLRNPTVVANGQTLKEAALGTQWEWSGPGDRSWTPAEKAAKKREPRPGDRPRWRMFPYTLGPMKAPASLHLTLEGHETITSEKFEFKAIPFPAPLPPAPQPE